ncbi:polynucleotide 5'-hydroxyl-kinase NOL9 isoform X2 [Oratosquilla oratoria]
MGPKESGRNPVKSKEKQSKSEKPRKQKYKKKAHKREKRLELQKSSSDEETTNYHKHFHDDLSHVNVERCLHTHDPSHSEHGEEETKVEDTGELEDGVKHLKVDTDTEKDKRVHLEAKKALVGEPLAVNVLDSENLLVVLEKGTKLYCQGKFEFEIVFGSVEVLGYVAKEKEKKVVYSLPSHALLPVEAVGAKDLSMEVYENICKNYNIPTPENSFDKEVVILKLSRFENCMTRFLPHVTWKWLLHHTYPEDVWSQTLSVDYITPAKCGHVELFHTNQEWKDVASELQEYIEDGKVPVVVLCGGKNVGKSTLLRYLSNSLLCQGNAEVSLLDLDPGQPETSVPTTLKCKVLKMPLLGPPYTHIDAHPSEDSYQILLGLTSPQFILKQYLKAVQDLSKHKLARNRPLLVNTMGWTGGCGLDIMVDVLRILKPSHVIQIQSSKEARNYSVELEDAYTSRSSKGITTEAVKLNYKLKILESHKGGSSKTHQRSKSMRNLGLLGYLSHLSSHPLGSITVTSPVKILWSTVAIHSLIEDVPKERILQVINGNLVALCHVPQKWLHFVALDLPQFLDAHKTWSELPLCIGWAIVRGIDVENKELHLLTPLSEQDIKEKVNAVLATQQFLPAEFYQLFGGTGGDPYLFQGVTRGAAKLVIGRQIKPRSHSK